MTKTKEFSLAKGAKTLSFLVEPTGKGGYTYINEKLHRRGCRMPTFEELAWLGHEVFVNFNYLNLISGRKGIHEIREVFNSEKNILSSTMVLYSSKSKHGLKSGAYIIDNPEEIVGKIKLDGFQETEIAFEDFLERKVKESPEKSRFVNYGFKCENIVPEKIKDNRLCIGIAGKEGAKKLSELAKMFDKLPSLSAFPRGNGETDLRVARLRLFNGCEPYSRWLHIDCAGWDTSDSESRFDWIGAEGYTFGVRDYKLK